MAKFNKMCFALTMAVAATSITGTAVAQEKLKWKAIGQPLATGPIQKNKEQPFFENFAARTGLPIEIDYKPIDTLGVKDTEQLRILKAGLFDIVSIRVLRNSRDEPTLAGLDIVGASPDFDTARKVITAFTPTVDEQLQKKFGAKLLGVWPFGPQILFCSKPIKGLEDMKGKKVRVIDQNLAKVMETLGATPVPMSFPEVHQALALGVVDCAVTDPGSANAAGWPEVTTHQLEIGFQLSPNAYGISLKSWKKLNADQQSKMTKAFKDLTDEIWIYAEEVHKDALNCNSGSSDCKNGKKFNLVNVPVKPEDIEIVKRKVKEISFPAWAETCDKSNPGCSAKWWSKVSPILGLK